MYTRTSPAGGDADESAETGGTEVALDTPRKRGAPGEGGDGRGVILPAKRKRRRGREGRRVRAEVVGENAEPVEADLEP